jgi:hypothetical protein
MDSILPFLIPQPRPEITAVGYLEVAGRTVTAITRRFAEADVRRCGLCPVCSNYAGTCTVLVDLLVPLDEAKAFDATATNFQPTERTGAAELLANRRMPWIDN